MQAGLSDLLLGNRVSMSGDATRLPGLGQKSEATGLPRLNPPAKIQSHKSSRVHRINYLRKIIPM